MVPYLGYTSVPEAASCSNWYDLFQGQIKVVAWLYSPQGRANSFTLKSPKKEVKWEGPREETTRPWSLGIMIGP